MAVDQYGNWTYQKEEKRKCDLDYIADEIVARGYTPHTSVENLSIMIAVYYDGYLLDNESEFYAIEKNKNAPMINVEDVMAYVDENGGFSEFDWRS